MKNKNQRGFTAIEVLIVLVVIVILGGVGYYVWHKEHKPAPVRFSSSRRGSYGQRTSWNFLDIKEWGVKVRIPAVPSPEYMLVGKNEAFLTTKTEQSDSNCKAPNHAADPSFPTFDAVVRALPTDAPIFGDDPGANPPKTVQAAAAAKDLRVTTVGNYDYYVLHGNGMACNDVDAHELEHIGDRPLEVQSDSVKN